MRNYEGKVYIWEGINQADAANDFACMPTEIADLLEVFYMFFFFLIFLALKNKNRKERSRKVVFVTANDFACMPTEIAFTFVIGLYMPTEIASIISHSTHTIPYLEIQFIKNVDDDAMNKTGEEKSFLLSAKILL